MHPNAAGINKAKLSEQDREDAAGIGAITGYIQASRSTSLYDHQDATRKDSMDYELKLVTKATENYSVLIVGGYSQDLHDSMASDFGDTVISGSHKAVDWGSYTQVGNLLSVIVPTSKESHVHQNLNLGARAGMSFGLNPIVNPDLTLSLGLSAGQNFHAYDTAIDGAPLTKYAFSQILSAGYAFGAFSISGLFKHKNGWTYNGQLQEAFEHAEELGYDISSHFSIAAGHTNSGAMLKANAQESNLDLINENSSLVYGSLTYLF